MARWHVHRSASIRNRAGECRRTGKAQALADEPAYCNGFVHCAVLDHGAIELSSA